MGAWQGVFGGAGDGSQGPGTLPTIAEVACGTGGQVYTAEDLPGRGQAWNGASMTYVAQIDSGAHTVSDSFAVATSPLDGSIAIVSHGVANSPQNFVQWFQQNLTWIRKIGTGGSGAGQFKELEGVAFDNAGNLYTYDTNAGGRVQKWDTSGLLVGTTGLYGSESNTVVLSDGLRCVTDGSLSGASVYDTSRTELFGLYDENGGFANVNAWYLPPGTGAGNTNCHIWTTFIYSPSIPVRIIPVYKYLQNGTLAGAYSIDLTQKGADLVLQTIGSERPFSFSVSGDETQFFLGTQPNDGGDNRAWIYKFSVPPDYPGETWYSIAGRGAC